MYSEEVGSNIWMPPTIDVVNEINNHEESELSINTWLKKQEINETHIDNFESKASYFIPIILKRLSFCRDTLTGFSLIRLGDGEGNVLSTQYLYNNYPNLLDYVQRKISHLHFGSLDVVTKNRFKLYNLIRESMLNADFVGAPDKTVVRRLLSNNEENIDIRGVFGLYYAAVEANSNVKLEKTVNWWISRSLLPYFDQIITSYSNVVLITNHEMLKTKFTNRFGSGITCYLVKIPNQAKLEKFKHKDTGFYPSLYLECLNNIPVIKGALYLVGAGLLGKFICNYIKNFKGQAIDVGSTADIWAGYITRPGMEQELIQQHSWI